MRGVNHIVYNSCEPLGVGLSNDDDGYYWQVFETPEDLLKFIGRLYEVGEIVFGIEMRGDAKTDSYIEES